MQRGTPPVNEDARKQEALARIRAAGVVGAGGSGFPTYVKLANSCDTVIVNGAECEPLLEKDQWLLAQETERVLDGLQRAAELVGARRKLLAVKRKRTELVENLRRACARSRDVEVVPLTDTYPAGDEYVLVHELTGRRPPPGGFPTDVGVLVQNDETLLNISRALAGEPVTATWLTVCGAVDRPFTAAVPLGTTAGELLSRAGGFTGRARDGAEGWVAMEGGAMMGRPVTDPAHPVTRTTAALLFLPVDHRVVRFATRTEQVQRAVNRSACDQCSYCTQFCPRYLLGYAVEPHRVMRAAGFAAARADEFDPWGRLCCECGICDLYACPEDLSPRDACRTAKRRTAALAAPPPLPADRETTHPLREGRLVPLTMLKLRLDLRRYDRPAPFRSLEPLPERVVVLHKQHVGAVGRPVVQPGQTVAAGLPLTAVPEQELGVPVHAPFAGTVREVTAAATVLERSL
jgi:Na+-translocating ferredoxin:NAD+ oxidoreductase RnfC subunit